MVVIVYISCSLAQDVDSMLSKRPRQCANRNVRESDYVDCLKSVAGKMGIEQALAPLVSESYRLTPLHVVRCAKLLDSLIDKGVQNGVILPARCQVAVKSLLGKGGDLMATHITVHIQLCFGMVRQMKLDEETAAGRARTRKSGTFKRLCSAGDRIIIDALVKKIVLSRNDLADDGAEEAGSEPCQPVAPSSSLSQPVVPIKSDAMEELRNVFKSGIQRIQSFESLDLDMDELVGIPSTVAYDDGCSSVFNNDGFPKSSLPGSCATSLAASPTVTPRRMSTEYAFIDGDDVEGLGSPPDPCSRRRCKNIMDARSSSKKTLCAKKHDKKNSKGHKDDQSTSKDDKKNCKGQPRKEDGALQNPRLARTKACGGKAKCSSWI